jgi:hypothetical protein
MPDPSTRKHAEKKSTTPLGCRCATKKRKEKDEAAATTQKKAEAENRLNTPPGCRSHAEEYVEALPHMGGHKGWVAILRS